MSARETINIPESEKTVLSLEYYNTKYNNLLVQYRQAVADYIDFLNNSNGSNTLTSISGHAFWGSGYVGKTSYTNITDVNGCANLCSKTKSCTGAIFRPTNDGTQCLLRSGDSDILPSQDPNEYAIVSQEKHLLYNIKNINEELTNVNREILNIINSNASEYSMKTTERDKKSALLLAKYKKLSEERKNISNMVREYENLDEIQNEGSLRVSENYYSFLLLLLLVVVFALLLYKLNVSNSNVTYGGALGTNTFNIILFVLIIIVIYVAFLRNIL